MYIKIKLFKVILQYALKGPNKHAEDHTTHHYVISTLIFLVTTGSIQLRSYTMKVCISDVCLRDLKR